LIEELDRALEDTNVKGSQRDEYKLKLAGLTEEMAHIQAERERAITYSVNREDGERLQNSAGPLRLVAFKTARVSEAAARELWQRAGVKIGDEISENSLKRIRAAAAAVDEHFKVVMNDDGRGGVSLVLIRRE